MYDWLETPKIGFLASRLNYEVYHFMDIKRENPLVKRNKQTKIPRRMVIHLVCEFECWKTHHGVFQMDFTFAIYYLYVFYNVSFVKSITKIKFYFYL